LLGEAGKIRQIAALPYRATGDGPDAGIQVLLVTSRETRRWVVPKGNLASGLAPHEAAAREAVEEAGVTGLACPTPLGTYRYRKRRRNGASLMFDVELFPLAVNAELDSWKEAGERERRWFSLVDAADAVEEDDLRNLMRSFAASEFRAVTRRETILGTVVKKSGIGSMFGWFQRLLPKQGNFFELFEAHVVTVVGGADALARAINDGAENREDHIREIHEREHDADEIIREVLRTVRHTFLTPFDRSAIISLIGSMDDAIDEMHAAAEAIDVYSVDDFSQPMKDMVAIIVDSTRLLAEAIPLLRDIGSNGKRLHELTERIVRMEGQADGIHTAGLKAAYKEFGARDPMSFIVRREIFKHLERIVDALEDVANAIDAIVIDHA
jgi:predicted phosphate transport protein (TIGR00153 family)